MISKSKFANAFVFFPIVLALWLCATTARAQTSSFVYQGRLSDGGTAANGNYDLQFALWDNLSGGSQIGSPQTVNAVAVSNGVFTVTIDFGASPFFGASRFLEISARPSGSGSFTLLAPRQQITSTPYAVRSSSSANADAATTATNATQLGGVAANQFVRTSDSRLSDPRAPTPGSTNYIQNSNTPQATSNFNITGNGTIGGTLIANGNVGIGTTTPGKRLTVAGDMEVGVSSGDYRHLRIGGGNSDGFLYGSFLKFADGIHLGYNYFADSAGNNHVINSTGGTSRLTMQYGAIVLATAPASGGEPIPRVTINSAGNMGIGTVAPASALDVRGNVRLGSGGQYFATSGEENLRIIRGTVDANGNILAGSGFRVIHTQTGFYRIVLDTGFFGKPSVTVTLDAPSVDNKAQLTGVNPLFFDIVTYDDTVGLIHSYGFDFIAVGPR
jgi:hypothetical protein